MRFIICSNDQWFICIFIGSTSAISRIAWLSYGRKEAHRQFYEFLRAVWRVRCDLQSDRKTSHYHQESLPCANSRCKPRILNKSNICLSYFLTRIFYLWYVSFLSLNRLIIDANQHPHRFAQTCAHRVSKVWKSQFIDYFYCEAWPMNNCFYWFPGRDLNPHSLSRNGFWVRSVYQFRHPGHQLLKTWRLGAQSHC